MRRNNFNRVFTEEVASLLSSSQICEELTKSCMLSMVLAWPIAAICAALAIFEFVYIFRCHGGHGRCHGGHGWCHSLSFLQAIPSHERGRRGTYSHSKLAGDDLCPNGGLLAPFTKYAGQSDSPPYTSARSNPPAPGPWEIPSPLGSKTALSFSSFGPASVSSMAGPYALSSASGYGHDDPSFEVPSRYRAHKAALIGSSYQRHKAALVGQRGHGTAALERDVAFRGVESSYASLKAALVEQVPAAPPPALSQAPYATNKGALIAPASYDSHKAALNGRVAYPMHVAGERHADPPHTTPITK